MLDVDGGPDVDAGFEQLLHILPAFGVAHAGGVGMGQLIEQQQRGAALQGGVEVEFLQRLAAIGHGDAGHGFQLAHGILRAGAAVGFDEPGHHIHPALALGMGGGEHLPGFADARRGTQKDFQMAAPSLGHAGQEGVGVRAGGVRG